MKRETAFQKIAEEVLSILDDVEAGLGRSWISVGEKAHNPATGTVYQGKNQLLLSIMARSFTVNRWMTFKQAKQYGGKVQKGATAYPLLKTDINFKDENGKKLSREEVQRRIEDKKRKTGRKAIRVEEVAPNTRRFLKVFNVFNVAHIQGLPDHFHETVEPELDETERDERADALIEATGADIRHLPQDEAYYSPGQDRITLPLVDQFEGKEDYYMTAFHELAHWTGHASRLDRKGVSKPGSYAEEELVAEMASAFVSSDFGLSKKVGHGQYIKSWKQAIKDDNSAIYRAIKAATKAADLILEKEPSKVEEAA